MTGFYFNGVHSGTFGIGLTAISHALKPAKRVTQLAIPNRHGTYDITDNTYGNITIKLDCVYIGGNFREAARKIGTWLSGSGELILDTEPDKRYIANAYAGIETSETGTLTDFTVTFDCQPFALSAIRQQDFIIAGNPESLIVVSGGTMETPAKIYIKNTGDKNVTGIKITIKKRCSI